MKNVNRNVLNAAVLALISIAGNASAQWTTIGSNIYYTTGNVGVGTTNPVFPIDARGNGARVISALNTATTGYSYGVAGLASSSSGAGVFGYTSAAVGTGYGMYGLSASDKGNGVVGYASSNTGRITTGVWGRARSTAGIGVYGLAEATSGSTKGVYGSVYSADGYAGYFTGGRNYFEGNVGIGVMTPAYPLDVSGDASIAGTLYNTSTSGYGVRVDTSGNSVYGLYVTADADTSTIGVYSESSSPGGAAVLGVCTATTGAAAAVSGTSQSPTGYAGNFVNSAAGAGTGIRGQGTGQGVVGVSNDTGVQGDGNLYDFYAAGPGTNYGAASSRRWKHNIVNIAEPLDKLAQLRGVYFDWDQAHGGKHDLGFIAEEVGKILPEIVVFEDNGIDASGMDYGKMTPLLVESINALRAEKDEQIDSIRSEKNAEIAALQAENQELRDRLDRLEALMSELSRR